MRLDAYQQMAEHEDRHWWFVGRRAVIDGILDRLQLAPGAQIAEIGCGSGGNLTMLAARGSVLGVEPFASALEVARLRHPGVELSAAMLPALDGLRPGQFDLIALLDVLEHVEDDASALRTLLDRLTPTGRILLTVPAHPSLYGAHDRRLHHFRRYSRRQLIELCRATGADIEFLTAFNTILSPIAVAIRLAERLGLAIDNQERLPAKPVNWLLARLFSLERAVARHARLPFGLSYAAVLRRSTEE